MTEQIEMITDWPEWLNEGTERVREEARRAVATYSASVEQRTLLLALLESGLKSGLLLTAIQLALLTYRAIKEEIDPAIISVTAGVALLEAGIYTLDHILDHEEDEFGPKTPPETVLLGAVSLISFLPQIVIASAVEDPGCSGQLMQLLYAGLASISGGQLRELLDNHRDELTVENVEQAILAKTGRRRQLYAELAATVAGGTAVQVKLYGRFAANLGAARQLHSDLLDLFGPRDSRDLASGIRTLPMVVYLSSASAEHKNEMLELLREARSQPAIRVRICNRLRESGAMRAVVSRTLSYCHSALSALSEAAPPADVRYQLTALVTAVSFR